MHFQNKSARSISPMNRKQQVSIIERSQSPLQKPQNIQVKSINSKYFSQLNFTIDFIDKNRDIVYYKNKYILRQQEIDAEIKAKANSKKITENSYKLVAHQLQLRIQSALSQFEQQMKFEDLGAAFTILEIFEVIEFDQNSRLIINETNHRSNRGQLEMNMHQYFWNLVTDFQKVELVDKEIVTYILRILMDPIKLDIDETAELLLDMLNQNENQALIEQAKKLVIQFRAITQDKLFSQHKDRKQDELYKYKEQQLRELTFTPQLNQRSIILATQNRSRFVHSEKELSAALFGDSYDDEKSNELCVSVMQKKQEMFLQKIKTQQEQKLNEQMKECTFQPQINKTYSNYNSSNVVDRLYSQESVQYKKLQMEQNQQLIKEYRQQEEMDQCTFNPQINEYIGYNPNSTTPRAYEKTVGRMRYALDIQREKLEKQKYVPTGEKYEKLKNSPFNPPSMTNRQKIKRQPLVIMDVNICPGKQGRLALYEDEDPKLVVYKFAKLFNLNREMSDTLLDVLKTERDKLIEKCQ